MIKIPPFICPFCKKVFKHIGKHYQLCNVGEHYRIIDFGKDDCEHLLYAKYENTFNFDETSDIKVEIRCKKCDLFMVFDTFERIWLPRLDLIKKLEKIK